MGDRGVSLIEYESYESKQTHIEFNDYNDDDDDDDSDDNDYDYDENNNKVWEPAHQLELVTKDAKGDPLFQWLVDHIQTLNDITSILGIGKGLEQSLEAAEEVGEKAYKLRQLSGTRFSAYFGVSIANFEKRMETNVVALRKRVEGLDKKVSETASKLLKRICSKEFLLLNLGILDVYQVLGSASKQLQTVEQFPWNVPKLQQGLIEQLRKMEKLKLSESNREIDGTLWKNFAAKLEDVLEDSYMTAQTAVFAQGDFIDITLADEDDALMKFNAFLGARRGRAAMDVSPHKSLLITVENRLGSLVRFLKTRLEERIAANPTPEIIVEMGKCFDLGDILVEEETVEVGEIRSKSLKKIMAAANYEEEKQFKIMEEYEEFKRKAKDLMKGEGENEETVKRFQHLLFKTHSCHPGCEKVLPAANRGRGLGARIKVCPLEGKVIEPREPNLMRIIHLFFKEASLYNGIKHLLHLYLRYDIQCCPLKRSLECKNLGVCLRPMPRVSLNPWAALWRCTLTRGGGSWTSATSARRP